MPENLPRKKLSSPPLASPCGNSLRPKSPFPNNLRCCSLPPFRTEKRLSFTANTTMFLFFVILIITLLLAVSLIIMVLLQPSKGGGASGAFGGLGSTLGSTFGSRRTLDFLAKGTVWVAGIIAALALLSNMFLIPRGEVATTKNPISTGTTVPSVPGMPAPVAPAATPAPATSTPATPAPTNAAPSTPAPAATPAPAQGK